MGSLPDTVEIFMPLSAGVIILSDEARAGPELGPALN